MKIRRKVLSVYLTATICAAASTPTMTPADGYPRFALGADVSWTPYIESNNLHTYYRATPLTNANRTTVAEMVSDHALDAVRLRVWVDPTSPTALSGFKFRVYGKEYEAMSTYGTCSVEEMTALAQRFAMQGHRVMVSFQLSDTWADPGRQFIPSAWATCADIEDLSTRACAFVGGVLEKLRDANVNVAWIQIGNETNTGFMKWQMPTSSDGVTTVTTPDFACEISENGIGTRNFVKVFGDVAREAQRVLPEVKTVLHLANAQDWSAINWTLSVLKDAGFSADICDYVGLSLYPGINDGRTAYTAEWRLNADRALSTIKNIYDEYGFRTIVCEVGMNNEYSLSANTTGVAAADLQALYIEQCNTDVAAFTRYMLDNLAGIASTCDGLFYWEPETDYMHGYERGACVSATPGATWPRHDVVANAWWSTMAAYSAFPAGGLVPYTSPQGGVSEVTADADAIEYYNLHGMRLSHPCQGVCIEKRGGAVRKIVVR